MSLRTDFLNHPAWALISGRIMKKFEEVTEAGYRDLASIQYNSGYRDALRDILHLPDLLLKEEEVQQESGELFIQNHPKATTGNW